MFNFDNLYKVFFHLAGIFRVISKGVVSKDVDTILDNSTSYFDKEESKSAVSDKEA